MQWRQGYATLCSYHSQTSETCSRSVLRYCSSSSWSSDDKAQSTLERKTTGCHFLSSRNIWERTVPVAKLELSASIRKGLVESGEMRTRAAVTLCLSLSKADCSVASQRHLESFRVKSNSGQACSEKSWINHCRSWWSQEMTAPPSYLSEWWWVPHQASRIFSQLAYVLQVYE